jgi:hypothetical protein
MPSLLKHFFYVPHLLETKHGVEFTWSPVIPNFVMKIWLGAKPAMVPKRSRGFIQLLVIGRDHPAFAGSEDFRREK